jgi:1,4-dihydroxy-2-naphthoate octaprenyltransferase
LKKYAITGYLTVMIFQGAFTFILCYHGCHTGLTTSIPVLPAVISSLLIGGFYPLTQIYQHKEDLKDGVKQSMLYIRIQALLYSGMLH